MNKKVYFLLLTALAALNLTYSQEAVRKSVAVTVYNSNIGVVKDLRSFDIKKGTSTLSLTDVAEKIDPTSVRIKLKGEALEQNYKYDLASLDKILQKYIDKNVQLVGEKDELIEGKLLSNKKNQIVCQKKDGGLLMLLDISKYKISVNSLPEGLITKPTLVWLINSPSSKKQDVEVSYQTAGLNWHAEYIAVLNKDDSKMDINSWVSIKNNSGAIYKDAKLKLVAGDVNIAKEPFQFDPGVLSRASVDEKILKDYYDFIENPFFEYHMYELQRPTTIANAETKQISLFEAPGIKITKKYLYNSGGVFDPYYDKDYSINSDDDTNNPNDVAISEDDTGSDGDTDANSNDETVTDSDDYSGIYSDMPREVHVIAEFENKKENNLGIPMPKGKVRLYKDNGGSLELIGASMIKHTPKNEKIELKLGNTAEVTAEEIQTDDNEITNNVSEESYKITLKNKKNEDITVDVQRYLGTNWEISAASMKYDNTDSNHITFHVPVKKDSETAITFSVKYSDQ
jgi:hypothetical protein